MLHSLLLFAEETAEKTTTGTRGFGMQDVIFIVAIGFMLYMFIVVLPGRRRQERERLEQMKKLNKNDEVLTIGGIYGNVISVSDTKDEVVVKVDDGTRLRITKGSIAKNITAEENAKKAKEEQQKK